MALRERQQNSTLYPLLFLMVDSTDHVTGKTLLTPTVTLSKNGAAFGSAAGAVSEIGNGWYALVGNATDRNTIGEQALHVEATGADPYDEKYTIVQYDPFAIFDTSSRASLTIAYDAAKTAGDATAANQATLNSNILAVPAAAWAVLTSTLTVAGSVGKLVADTLSAFATMIPDLLTDVEALQARLAEQVAGTTPVVVVAAPPHPSQSIGYTYCYGADGNLDPTAQIEFSLVTPPATDPGTSYASFQTAKPYSLSNTDADKRGRLDVTLLKGAVYRAKRTDGAQAISITVPSTDSFELPQTLARPAF